jgi:nitrite reductase (NADH) small subunit
MQWIQVARAGTIPPRQGRELHVGDLSVAVFIVGDRYLAIENRCPHSGDPLADGMVVDTTVTCELHHWRICLETGLVIKPCIEGNGDVPDLFSSPMLVADSILSAHQREISGPSRSREATLTYRSWFGSEYSSCWFGIIACSLVLRCSASTERPINTCQTSTPVRKNERSGTECVTTPNSVLSSMFSSTALPGANFSGR